MPPPVLHMSLAKTLADSLSLPDIDADRGAYYLGSTAPDIRTFTQQDRALTHFFNLNDFGPQDSVSSLFAEYSDLQEPARLNTGTVSFLAGYITHLVLDERWITDIYRPLFGERSVLASDKRANLMDRIIQFEMDRKRREERATLDAMSSDIVATALEVSIGFIDIETLRRWRDINIEFLQAPPTWDRFRNVARRHLSDHGVRETDDVDRFMEGVPDLLQKTVDHVGWQRVQAYIDSSISLAASRVKDYLS